MKSVERELATSTDFEHSFPPPSKYSSSPPSRPPRHKLSAMTSPSDELAYLKSLVNQLTVKINELEAKAASKKPTPSPAQQLRTILIGPPGAGMCRTRVCARSRVSALISTAWSTLFFFLLMLVLYRQGHAGTADTRGVLCLPPRDG